NFINPWSVFNWNSLLGDALPLDDNERKLVAQLRAFLDSNFKNGSAMTSLGVVNTPEEAERLMAFVQKTYDQLFAGQGGFAAPLGLDWSMINTDLYNVFIAEKVIEEFKPELLVLNMTDTDICHQNFTEYLNNLRKADWAVSHLWNFIQSTPGMAGDTVMVLVPEHGRNLEPNTIIDSYGRAAVDHTGDPTSREIFCMFVGPQGVIPHGRVVGDASNPVGESIDVVKTIAELLGFGPEIPAGMLKGRVLEEALA
ncbi:MAG: alkaline phosphatase family protein, partial [Bacteroidia bacterium]|nr:alkaline phosphatase family protein [Bacteroidia bacterium]MDW8335090.1 alkaline phosphatase family protein [Bacteroidia bacterium]